MGVCGVHESQHLDYASFGTVPTKVSTDASDTDEMINAENEFDYATVLDDDSVPNEIMVGGTTYTLPINSVSAKHLCKRWKTSEKTAEKTINITIQRCVRAKELTLK